MSKTKRQYGSLMTISLVSALLIITLGLTVNGEDQKADQVTRESISILIIDQTGSFATSMQTELLARNLTNQFDANVQARTDIPGKVSQEKSYGLIFVIPERLPRVWILTGLVPYKVPEEKRKALEGIQKIATKIYSQEDFPKRKVVGIVDDLAPAAYASYLVRYGWLEGPENFAKR